MKEKTSGKKVCYREIENALNLKWGKNEKVTELVCRIKQCI